MTITDKQVEAAPVAFAIMTPTGISVEGWMDYARLYEYALRTVTLTEGCSYVFAYAAPSSAEQPAKAHVPAQPAGPEDMAIYDRIAQRHFDSVAAAVPGAPEADERARFEAWAGSEGFITQRDQFTFGYYATVTNDAWEVWQARAQSSAAPSVAPVSTRDGEPFGWAVVDKNGCTERVVSRVHYEFNCAEPVIRAGVAHDLLPYLDREYRGAAPHRIVTLYTAPPADARDSGRALLRQAIDAMSKLRQSLEFPGKHGGLYVFPEHAVRKFTDEQARLMYEEKRLAEVAQECVTDSARLEFVMQKFPGSAARDAGITWSANTIDDYRAAIDRAMGGE